MAQSGRVSGFKIGYMQVFHPYYLWRKGIISFFTLNHKFVWRYLIINMVKVITGDPVVDRPGRLKGNFRAAMAILGGEKLPKIPSD